MKKFYIVCKRSLLVIISLSLTLSCQPQPVGTASWLPLNTAPNLLEPHNPSTLGDFSIENWPTETLPDPNSMGASMSYSGTDRKYSSRSINKDSPHVAEPQYNFTILDYQLTPDGKQYASYAFLRFSAEYVKQEERMTDRDSLSVGTFLRSTNGTTFSPIDSESAGYGGYYYTEPDGLHGNLGNLCQYGESGDYPINHLSGSVTLNEQSQTFNANLHFTDAMGRTAFGLSPWQCSFQCIPGQGDYNETCHNELKVNGSIHFSGKVTYRDPNRIEAVAWPPIISPANQDDFFDFSTVAASGLKAGQLYRVVLPPFNGTPLESTWWQGRKTTDSFYEDGTYEAEVISDRYQHVTTQIKVDNTPPQVSSPQIVERFGRKAVEILVEDPLVNGVRAGLLPGHDRSVVVRSYRPGGSWKTTYTALDANRALYSMIFIPHPDEPQMPGSYDESLEVSVWDRVYNETHTYDIPFNFDVPPVLPTPLPPIDPPNECEEMPILLPEDLASTLNDSLNVQPTDPQVLNQYRSRTERLKRLEAQLAQQGVTDIEPLTPPVSAPEPEDSFEIQAFDASAFPGVDVYSLPPKAQRLVSTYRDLRREQESYRQSVLESIQNLDGALQQSLLKQTQLFRAEYVELEAPSGDSSFEDYKELLTDLDEELESELLTKNTYSFLNATRAYTNLGLFYNHLLRALLLGYLPEDNVPSDPEEVDLLTDNLATMTKPIQLVNYTARRLKALKNRLQNRYNQLSQNAEELKVGVTLLKEDLDHLLHNQIGGLVDEVRMQGIQVNLDEYGISVPEPSPSTVDFQVQFAPVIPFLIGGAGTTFTSEVAAQFATGLLVAATQATLAQLASDTVVSAITQANQENTRHTRSLERELTKSNLSPEERILKEAQLADLQAAKDKLGDLITRAKQYRDEAERKARDAESIDASSKDTVQRPCTSQRRKKKPTESKKAGSSNKPDWVDEFPYVGESGKTFAKRMCDSKDGKGNYDTGPGSEFNQIKKWVDRSFWP